MNNVITKLLWHKNSVLTFVRFRNHLITDRSSRFYIKKDRNVYFKLKNESVIELRGNIFFNYTAYGNNGRSSILRMDENTRLIVNDKFYFYYGADIILFKNAVLELGSGSFINSNCKIRCHSHITIGNNCSISHDFTIMDSDAHMINGHINTKPVLIKDNVWIGSRVMILKGVTIGEGAVIAAGSIVTKDIPARCLAAGVPAKVIKENIYWE